MELTFGGNTDDMFHQLLEAAVNEPGTVMEAYNAFHNYSFGNQMLAYWQLKMRGVKVGPIAPYGGWTKKGRQVKRGAKAITLLVPITSKKKVKNEETGEDELKTITFGKFVPRNKWFALSQTYVPCGTCRGAGGKVGATPMGDKVCEKCKGSGENPNAPEYRPTDIPEYNFTQALDILKLVEVEFEMLEGNPQGYAQSNKIAINPLAQLPYKTRFHEIAHILLGHTKDGAKLIDNETTLRSLAEVEAESVALLCVSALNLPGAEFCRSYIQGWLKGATSIPAESARKIMVVADKIIKAGTIGKVNEKGEEAE